MVEVWRLVRTSCTDGGQWAWVIERLSGAEEMVGCACHHIPPAEVTAIVERPTAGSVQGGMDKRTMSARSVQGGGMTEVQEALASAHRLVSEPLGMLPDYRMDRALAEIERLLGYPWPIAAVRDRLAEALGTRKGE